MNTQSNRKIRKNRLAQCLALALALPLAASAFAQSTESTSQDDQDEDTTLEEVVVTGSRIKRSEVEGPAPVTVITAQQIEREGHATVYDALNTLTQSNGSIQNELFQNGFTPNANVINLRALGPGATLVLINGRRAADYPLPYNGQSNFVNLGSIPAAAVERIEVLAGGASAIYGSDAVAGVVNIVLKTNFEGDVLTGRYGTTTEGGGDSWDLQWVGGKVGDKWSLTYAFEYLDRDPIWAADRDFMDSYRDDPSTDFPVPVEGLRIRDRLSVIPTPGGNFSERIGVTPATCAQFAEFEPWTAGSQFGGDAGQSCGYFGYPATQQIRNSDSNWSAYGYGTWDFSENLHGFASLSFWKSKAEAASATQFWGGVTPGALIIDDDLFGRFSIFDMQRIITPTEIGGRDVQQTVFNERAIDFAAGLRGLWADKYDWELAYSHSRYDADVDQPRLVASLVNDYFLGPRLGTLFGFPYYDVNEANLLSPISPEAFEAMSTIVKTNANSTSDQFSFVVSGDMFDMPGGPAAFAAVAEYATQEYDLENDERIAPGYTGADRPYNLTGTGGGGDRDRYALGVEFKFPLHDTFTASLAGRFDSYKWDGLATQEDGTVANGNFDPSAFTWNAGLEWRPTDNLLLRGSYSTSFRAPDMHFLFAEESGFFSTVFDEYNCRNDGNDVSDCGFDPTYNYSSFGTRRGDAGLEEETGRSYTLGFVWDVIDNLSVSVDYFNIELEGVVTDLSSAYILRNEADCRLGMERDGTPVDINSPFCQYIIGHVTRVVGGPNDGRISEVAREPINSSFLGTTGIDAALNYKFETERYGDFAFNLQWSHTLTQKYAEFEGEPRDDYRDSLQNFDWRSRVRATTTWQPNDNWTATLFMTRYGSLPNWEETGRIAPYFIYNTNISWKATNDLEVSLIVNNIRNTFHPRDDSFFTYPFFWRGFSPIGREVFLQAEWTF
jgi:outer membrane receptor protein involved in Fe transport